MRNLKTFESFSYNGYAVNEGVWDAIKGFWRTLTSRRDDLGDGFKIIEQMAELGAFQPGAQKFRRELSTSELQGAKTKLQSAITSESSEVRESRKSNRYSRSQRLFESNLTKKEVGDFLVMCGFGGRVLAVLTGVGTLFWEVFFGRGAYSEELQAEEVFRKDIVPDELIERLDMIANTLYGVAAVLLIVGFILAIVGLALGADSEKTFPFANAVTR